MGTIADYLLTKRKMASDEQQNMVNNILNAAKTGVDVWGAVQESGKYKPGSDFMNAQKDINLNWPMQSQQNQFGLEKSLWDYKVQNPGKTAEQLTQEWWLTPEGQAAQQKGYTREDAVRATDHLNRMAEIAAAQGGKGLQQSTWEAYKQALGGAQDAFLMRDENGQPTWKPSTNKEAVRQFLYKYVSMADSADQDKLKSLFDAWVDNPTMPGAQPPPAPTEQGVNPVDKAMLTYENLVNKTGAFRAIPQRGGTAKDYTATESALENTVRGLIGSAQTSGSPDATTDVQVLQRILDESSAPGLIGGRQGQNQDQRYRTLKAIVDMLQKKYGGQRTGAMTGSQGELLTQ